MKSKFIVIMFLTLALSNCGVYQDSNDNEIDKMREFYMGRSKQEVIINWGKPDEVSSDGDGGEILTYHRLNNAGMAYWTTNFYINKDKKVYWANAYRK